MWDTFLRILSDDEKNILHLLLEDKENEYRAKIILLKDERYAVSQIREITNHNKHNIRKWIHGIDSKKKELMVSHQRNTITNSTNLLMFSKNK
jgi:hypothetical protein